MILSFTEFFSKPDLGFCEPDFCLSEPAFCFSRPDFYVWTVLSPNRFFSDPGCVSSGNSPVEPRVEVSTLFVSSWNHTRLKEDFGFEFCAFHSKLSQFIVGDLSGMQ